jgi:uncharacterized damage-inducible protein DinB
MSNSLLISLFEHKAWCNRGLIEALRAAPETADRRELAVALFTFDHTNVVDRIFQAHLMGAEHGIEDVVATRFPQLDELARTMAETDAWYLDYVRDVTPAELEEVVTFTFVDGDPGRMTRGEILAHVITHGASHRGAVGKMLEQIQVRGASDMVTTFSRVRREGPAR